MTDQEAAQFAQGLYDTIFASLTNSPDGKPSFDPNKTYLVMQKPGRFINPATMANPWTPGNPQGSKTAAGEMWDLVNYEPNFAPVQEADAGSGRRLSDMYQDILRSTVTIVDTQDPALKKQYDDAYNLLWTKGKNENGQDTVFQSDAYSRYDQAKGAWVSAQSSYQNEYQKAMATPEGKANWPIISPGLQLAVRQAWDQWRSGGADIIENALAKTNTSGTGQVARAFSDAQFVFGSYGADVDGSGVMQERSALSPSDWYMASQQKKWGSVHWTHATSVKSASSDFSSGGGGASVNLGLWSVGGGASHTSSHFRSDASLASVDVSYQYIVLQIRRPWMNQTLFSYPGWKNQAYPKGKLSAGGKSSAQKNTLFPLVPQAMIVIKNLVINANFSKQEIDQASSQTSGGASVGWGPFSVSGHYSHKHETSYVKGEIAPGHLSVPFMQVVGWICQLNPAMPPQ